MKRNISITLEQARGIIKDANTPAAIVDLIKSNFTEKELTPITASYDDLKKEVGEERTELFEKILFVAYKLNTNSDIESGTPCTIALGKRTKNVTVIPTNSDFKFDKKSLQFKSFNAATLAYENNKELFHAYWSSCRKEKESHVTERCPVSNFLVSELGSCENSQKGKRMACFGCQHNKEEVEEQLHENCPTENETLLPIEKIKRCFDIFKGKHEECLRCPLKKHVPSERNEPILCPASEVAISMIHSCDNMEKGGYLGCGYCRHFKK